MTGIRGLVWLAALGAGAAGCGAHGQGDIDAGADAYQYADAAMRDPTGSHYNFVIDGITMPRNGTEAESLGLDIDLDGEVDNALGAIVTAFNAGGTDVNDVVQGQIDRGEIILLADVQATALTDARDVGFWAWKGADANPPPCLDEFDTVCRHHLAGDGTFTVAAADPAAALVVVDIDSGRLHGGPGTVTLEVPLGFVTTPLVLDLIGVRVDTTIGLTGMTDGRLAGAVTADYVQASVLPQLLVIMGEIVAADCQGGVSPDCCVPDSQGEQLINLFDLDGTCDLSMDDLQNSTLLTNLLAPDLDLLDEEGFYVPNHDGVLDSTSLGIGFHAVPAFYPLPTGI
ncbi:MAG TPA: hypothetical protein VL172_13115 [Kofleriaceae bacterium]|nr:hypothetical protein [Kofleriaceae bacterium]